MAVITTFTFEELSDLIKSALQDSGTLSYISDDAITTCTPDQKDIVPEFTNYLIRIFPLDSGFLTKTPRIGNYYRNTYSVAIELWVKSGSRLADRLGYGDVRVGKGLYEFFQDVSDTLEHNTFSNQLDPFPGSSIVNPASLASAEQEINGIGFIWMGNQDNTT